MAERQLVVFDFDWSMADQDTDRWIFEVNAPDIRRKMEDLESSVQWTDLVAQSLLEGYEKGIKRKDIEHALKIIPYHPAMVRAVTTLKARGNTTFLCLSNANSVFISTILQEKGLDTLFEEIITNPAEWDTSGLLRLRRRIDPEGPQHGCKIGCSPNMCKVLFSQDIVCCRTFGGLPKRIARDGELFGLKCQVKYWTGAWELEEIFNTL
ncbi:hypothetical protein HHX47_DHR3000717 [Lentinula edodes]|nr:hypothetical protein HHX47_DHR3000717 [Lentinula edodes]